MNSHSPRIVKTNAKDTVIEKLWYLYICQEKRTSNSFLPQSSPSPLPSIYSRSIGSMRFHVFTSLSTGRRGEGFQAMAKNVVIA
jgi:hypothetical protein